MHFAFCYRNIGIKVFRILASRISHFKVSLFQDYDCWDSTFLVLHHSLTRHLGVQFSELCLQNYTMYSLLSPNPSSRPFLPYEHSKFSNCFAATHLDAHLLTATSFKNFHFKNWLKHMNTKSTNKFNQENTISSSNIKHWGIQWDLLFLHPPY